MKLRKPGISSGKGILPVRAVIILLSLLVFVGCGPEKREEDVEDTISGPEDYRAYYLNQEANEIGSEVRASREDSPEVREMMDWLMEEPKDSNLKRVLGESVSLLSIRLDEGHLILNFGEDYLQQPKAEEVLFRASVVHTVLQSPDVHSVAFSVDGKELLDRTGKPVGIMTNYTFIDSAGDEISSYSRRILRLYFADASGTKLVRTEQETIYSVNVSLEKLVMEKLIEGPQEHQVFPTISPEVKLNAINIKDGICYVSLDTSLMDRPVDVTEQVVLYSIVNSLAEVPDIKRVQITINGETDRMLRNEMSLDKIYEPDYSLVK